MGGVQRVASQAYNFKTFARLNGTKRSRTERNGTLQSMKTETFWLLYLYMQVYIHVHVHVHVHLCTCIYMCMYIHCTCGKGRSTMALKTSIQAGRLVSFINSSGRVYYPHKRWERIKWQYTCSRQHTQTCIQYVAY